MDMRHLVFRAFEASSRGGDSRPDSPTPLSAFLSSSVCPCPPTRNYRRVRAYGRPEGWFSSARAWGAGLLGAVAHLHAAGMVHQVLAPAAETAQLCKHSRPCLTRVLSLGHQVCQPSRLLRPPARRPPRTSCSRPSPPRRSEPRLETLGPSSATSGWRGYYPARARRWASLRCRWTGSS